MPKNVFNSAITEKYPMKFSLLRGSVLTHNKTTNGGGGDLLINKVQFSHLAYNS